MLFGCCVNMLPKSESVLGENYIVQLAELGYDYVELPLNGAMSLSATEFKAAVSRIKMLNLPVYACNNFFPAEIKLCGAEIDEKRISEYYKEALERAAALGAGYAVFGSPWSKECPEGFSKEKAFKQLVKLCYGLGETAKQYKITIAIEPNNHLETNMINTFAESVQLAKETNHPNVKSLQDYFHLKVENDTVASLLRDGKEYLVHSHFAKFAGRKFPKAVDEDGYYRPYFAALKEIGYDGGISMEGFTDSQETFAEDARATLAFFRGCCAM